MTETKMAEAKSIERKRKDHPGYTDEQIAALEVMRSDLTFNERLVLARIEIGELTLVKDAMGQSGSHKYPYATLDSILNSVMPVLNKWGLNLYHTTSCSGPELGDWITVCTKIVGVDGTGISSSLAFPPQDDAKALGSYRTYCARYNTNSILGLSLEQDDDGEKTTKPGSPRSATKAKPQQQQQDDDSIEPGDHVVTPISVKTLKETDSWKLSLVNCKEGSFKTFSVEVAALAELMIAGKSQMKVRLEQNQKGTSCTQAKVVE